MTARSSRTRAVVWMFAATLAACRTDEHSPLGVAERFVDQHYVQIDLEGAKPFCTGLALQKVEREQQLTHGQVIDDSTRKPTVRYRLLQSKDGGDHTSFVFEATIQVDDAGEFTRKWLISTRRDGALWKVSNFEEFD
jgi:hypothetical protein